jgi:hypothetical protein
MQNKADKLSVDESLVLTSLTIECSCVSARGCLVPPPQKRSDTIINNWAISTIQGVSAKLPIRRSRETENGLLG